jgi:pSer/pThr/pTyr-binding forkhead associated (FHA) protein
MTQQATSQGRASATKVAKWLVDKGRADDAVSLLAAFAANGPNDAEGQQLLAEALRINSAAIVARHAFAHMEGLPGKRPELDAAIAKWNEAEVQKLLKELSQPSFNRAQVGFNNNVKYQAHVYHIQTEDSGLNKPHVITHLFADGGRIIKSHKRSYANELGRADVAAFVRGLMKGQQMEMIVALRDGKFDDIIAGKAVGGMETLEAPPNVELKKLAKKAEPEAPKPEQEKPQKPAIPVVEEHADALKPVAEAPPLPNQPISLVRPPEPEAVPLVRPPRVRFRIHVLRSLVGGPDIYEPKGDDVLMGSQGGISLPGEKFCHPSEAILQWKNDQLWLEDIEGGNGVFWRVRTPVELEPGDEFIVGDQLLRIEKNPTADDGPDPDPTYFYSSPKWPSSFRVVQIFEGGAPGATVVARGTTLTIGSSVGDLVFADDPLVSEQHCFVEEQAGSIVVTDLQSRTGVFVRVKGEQQIEHGDQLAVGRTRLAVDLSPSGRG